VKKLWKRAWLIALALIVLGAAIAGLGLSLGGTGTIYYDADGLHAERASDAETRDSYELQAFTSLDATLYDFNFTLVPSDRYAIEIVARENHEPSVAVANGKLTILTERTGFTMFALFYGGAPSITVYFPADTPLDAVRISGVSGALTLGDAARASALGRLSVSSVSGAVRVVNAATEGADVSTTSGGVALSGEFGGVTRAESVSGNVTLRLTAANEPPSYELTTVSGAIRVNGARQGDTRRAASEYVSETRFQRVKTTSGNIDVYYG
jgi:hypothetical protein